MMYFFLTILWLGWIRELQFCSSSFPVGAGMFKMASLLTCVVSFLEQTWPGVCFHVVSPSWYPDLFAKGSKKVHTGKASPTAEVLNSFLLRACWYCFGQSDFLTKLWVSYAWSWTPGVVYWKPPMLTGLLVYLYIVYNLMLSIFTGLILFHFVLFWILLVSIL